MNKKPIKVKLISQEGKTYQIKFPNLKIPVTVNEYLYNKMLNSSDYKFIEANVAFERSISA